MSILHDDWLIRLGENRPDQSSQTFGGNASLYTVVVHIVVIVKLFASVQRAVSSIRLIPHELILLSI